jgi:hypothetical protein
MNGSFQKDCCFLLVWLKQTLDKKLIVAEGARLLREQREG